MSTADDDEHVRHSDEVRGLGQVDTDEPQARQKSVDGIGVEQFGGDESAQLRLDLVAVAGFVEPGPGHRDDPGVGGQLAVPVAQVQRGQQLPDGEVTRAAEDHEVAGVSNGRCRHLSLLMGGGRTGLGHEATVEGLRILCKPT